MSEFSTFLFARPSFIEGAGRILDFGNTLSEYNGSSTPEEADFRAFCADWSAVESDLARVIEGQGHVRFEGSSARPG